MRSVQQFAERIGASPRVAREIIKSGAIPAYRIGGEFRIADQDIEKYLESCRIEAVAPALKDDLKELIHRCVERARARRLA